MKRPFRWIYPVILAVVTLFHPGLGKAADGSMDNDVRQIAVAWAHITYEVKDRDDQETQMTALAESAAEVANRYPDRAEPVVWWGIVTSAEAGYANPFSALSLAKTARQLLEKAGRLNYRALDGAVPTSLGALYYMVPGFPLGFGDNEKAREYLEQGIAISPNGLDSNYFYGDFLFRQGEYNKAAAALNHALGSPVDRDRPVWDAGRRADIKALLGKVDRKLAARD